MQQTQRLTVNGLDGVLGQLEQDPRTGGQEQVALRLADGQRVFVDRAALRPLADGSYYLPLRRRQLQADPDELEGGPGREEGQSTVVPVVEEHIEVEKREKEVGKVVVRVTPRVREEVVDVPLTQQTAEVRRVEVNRFVDEAPPVREEGDELVVPVVEEVLVVEKRIRLKEEVRVRRRATTRSEPQRYTVRSEEAKVERVDSPD